MLRVSPSAASEGNSSVAAHKNLHIMLLKSGGSLSAGKKNRLWTLTKNGKAKKKKSSFRIF